MHIFCGKLNPKVKGQGFGVVGGGGLWVSQLRACQNYEYVAESPSNQLLIYAEENLPTKEQKEAEDARLPCPHEFSRGQERSQEASGKGKSQALCLKMTQVK